MLYDYYLTHFTKTVKSSTATDNMFESFDCMISSERNQSKRELFFSRLGSKLKGISLLNDKVMTFHGIPEALGTICANNRFKRLDFSFPYTHENPFPVGALFDSTEVDNGFNKVFSEIADFFR